ncbi:DUF4145 domain-containing protein [Bordetella genomosp. 2]|uniref:DUF4145 domain-containing protein n=1 Tax=Bordetella genomosp. 2 TaxID=1983456 RepID=A0A261W2D2_9BORD|nr:DUF4145 domain-containing protein [Bordetella genomosp. 2]OZI79892.1 hypothetical protein CAL24_08255 [Bordetella genomosp. 2]
MALTLMLNCPHCHTQNAAFTLAAQRQKTREIWYTLYTCNTCLEAVVATLNTRGGDPGAVDGSLRIDRHFHGWAILSLHPEPQETDAPRHCPEAVQKAFVQADEALKRKHWDSAVAMDRRALELSTKTIAPDLAKLTLYKRIEELAKNHKITPDLQAWAHGLRVVGNDALHEIDGVDEMEANQAHELTRYMLIYLFTLPTEVASAKGADAAAEQ